MLLFNNNPVFQQIKLNYPILKIVVIINNKKLTMNKCKNKIVFK